MGACGGWTNLTAIRLDIARPQQRSPRTARNFEPSPVTGLATKSPAVDRRLQQSLSDSEVDRSCRNLKRFAPHQPGLRSKVGTPGKCGAHFGALATKML